MHSLSFNWYFAPGWAFLTTLWWTYAAPPLGNWPEFLLLGQFPTPCPHSPPPPPRGLHWSELMKFTTNFANRMSKFCEMHFNYLIITMNNIHVSERKKTNIKLDNLVLKKFLVQSNLDYPDLDYPDFSIIRTFSLVPILSWIFISHHQDPSPYSF